MQSPQLDRFARDARAWKECAEINYIASGHLFSSSNLFVYVTAATLGHHALEMLSEIRAHLRRHDGL
jgi:hypothetical protein